MRKRTRRKRWALIDPITYAITGAKPTDRSALDVLLLRELSSLEALAKGHGTKHEWQDMAVLNALCKQMAERGIGPEALPVTEEVERHLIESAKRFDRTGVLGLTGPAIQAMRDMLAYHDLQRASVARSVYEESIRVVTAHVKSGHTRNVRELA